ncbi:hypothetical protein [Actinokineospora fastidiosa]|uniref:Uncharacterized protein n=1 Tax=Actinokineospora fastidiosa TaxID=1816 RepID=A0A918L926_9PSEU|nr:hypothetical protein [Actinokineospora fastidiosa]GGS21199.1 hypothetical protein GCM10010171_12360 [Actinokineospora fastidiosa]
MAKQAYSIHLMQVARNRKPEYPFDMGNLDGTNLDFLTLFHGFLMDVQGTPLVNRRSNLYLTVESVEPKGRTIAFTADQGRFGTEGKLVDVQSGSMTKTISENESAVTTTRNLVVASDGGPFALLLGERYGNHSSVGTVLSTFYRAFVHRFREQGFVFRGEGYVDQEAWDAYLQEAEMKTIQVNKYEASSDIADGFIRRSIGKIVCEVRPKRGEGSFTRKVRDQLLGGELKAHSIIGIEEDPSDEVELTLNDGRQQKRLLIGKSKVPVLLYPLTEGDEERLSDQQVLDTMLAKVSDLQTRVGMNLPATWKTEEWTLDQLDVKMAAYRE